MAYDVHVVEGWRVQLQRLEQEVNDGAGNPDAALRNLNIYYEVCPVPSDDHTDAPSDAPSDPPAVEELQADLQLSAEGDESPNISDDVFEVDEEPQSPITPTSDDGDHPSFLDMFNTSAQREFEEIETTF